MIGERVLELRKNLNMSQEEFGQKLSMTKSAISKIEKGENGLSEKNISLICSLFNINETWLRYGAGDMFILYSNDMIAEFEKNLKLGKVFRSALKSYIEADEFTRKVIDNFFLDVVNGVIDLSDNEYRMEDDADEDKPAR